MFEIDELRIYRGKNIPINNKIQIKIPRLGQIEEFGERQYFAAVYNLTSVGADLKWQLWDMGIDYTKIEDYDLFIKLTSQLCSSRKQIYRAIMENPEKFEGQLGNIDLNDLLVNPLELVLDGLDLADFSPFIVESTGQVVLYNQEKDITIDRMVYAQIVDVVRKLHGFKRNNQKPGNEQTKMDLIEDARDEARAAANRPYKSVLQPLVSTLQVSCGQCGDERIWDMPISMFFDNIKRSAKIQDANVLLQSAYSGFANLKGIDKSRFDMFGDL